MNDITHKIIQNAVNRYCEKHNFEKLNLLSLAKKTHLKTSSLWFYMNNERKWQIIPWLKVLTSLEYIEISNEEIKLHLPDSLLNELRSIRDG